MKRGEPVRPGQEVIKNMLATSDSDAAHLDVETAKRIGKADTVRIPEHGFAIHNDPLDRTGKHEPSATFHIGRGLMTFPAERRHTGRIQSVLKEIPFGVIMQ